MSHALVRGDARMVDDPLRAQALSYAAGCALVVVAMVVHVVLVLARPGAAPEDAPILMARGSGALYVRVADTVHPVLNLASARLVAGRPADPVVVDDATVGRLQRGPTVGIAGAPAQIGAPLGLDEASWTLCDVTGSGESLLLVAAGEHGPRALPDGEAVLASAHTLGAPTYLLADGRRARVDLRDTAVVRALRLEDVPVRRLSQSLLDSVPEVPALRAPVITAVGSAGPPVLGGLTVGTVVQVARSGPTEFYLVLAGGLQRISPVAADVIRFSTPQSASAPPVVPADVVAGLPIGDEVAVPRYPDRVRRPPAAVVCARWHSGPARRTAHTAVLVADSILEVAPGGGLHLAQADGEGPNIDRVQVPAGRAVLVRPGGVTREDAVAGPRYLLNDLGVLYGVRDDTAAQALGYAGAEIPAPWPMLSMLPRGPELNRDAASITRDTLPGGRTEPS